MSAFGLRIRQRTQNRLLLWVPGGAAVIWLITFWTGVALDAAPPWMTLVADLARVAVALAFTWAATLSSDLGNRDTSTGVRRGGRHRGDPCGSCRRCGSWDAACDRRWRSDVGPGHHLRLAGEGRHMAATQPGVGGPSPAVTGDSEGGAAVPERRGSGAGGGNCADRGCPQSEQVETASSTCSARSATAGPAEKRRSPRTVSRSTLGGRSFTRSSRTGSRRSARGVLSRIRWPVSSTRDLDQAARRS